MNWTKQVNKLVQKLYKAHLKKQIKVESKRKSVKVIRFPDKTLFQPHWRLILQQN